MEIIVISPYPNMPTSTGDLGCLSRSCDKRCDRRFKTPSTTRCKKDSHRYKSLSSHSDS
jgi:hypothetical protein